MPRVSLNAADAAKLVEMLDLIAGWLARDHAAAQRSPLNFVGTDVESPANVAQHRVCARKQQTTALTGDRCRRTFVDARRCKESPDAGACAFSARNARGYWSLSSTSRTSTTVRTSSGFIAAKGVVASRSNTRAMAVNNSGPMPAVAWVVAMLSISSTKR